jgi:hypothetical protein
MPSKIWSFLIACMLGLLLAGCGVAGEDTATAPSSDQPETEEETPLVESWKTDTVYVYQKDEWRLEVEYRAKGSRSEGQTGKLYKGAELVTGKKGERKETPLGEMMYYGDEPKTRWSPVGWNFADRRKMRNSMQLPAKDESSK